MKYHGGRESEEDWDGRWGHCLCPAQNQKLLVSYFYMLCGEVSHVHYVIEVT